MTIDIEIEHRNYYHLLEVLPNVRGEAILSPMVEDQKRAIVKLFVVKDGKRFFLKDYAVDLSKTAVHPKKIKVTGFITKYILEIDITTKGLPPRHDRISLKKYTEKSILSIILIPGVFLLLAILSLAGYRIISSPQTEVAPSPQIPSQIPQTLPSEVNAPQKVAPSLPESSLPESPPESNIKVAPSPSESQLEPPAPLSVSVSLNEKIYFYPNSIKVRESETSKLSRVLDILSSHPELKVTIAGHCALFGTKKGREKLSRNRAEKIASFLRGNGWKPETPPKIIWYGADKIVSKDPEKNYLNRRVEIFTEQLPLHENHP